MTISRPRPKQTPEQLYQRLLYKYSHVGCPAAHYEDNCDRPGECAENGRCLDLPNVGGPTENQPGRSCCKPDGSCCDFCCGN